MKIKKRFVVLFCPILSIFLLAANCNCAIEAILLDHSNKHSNCHNETPYKNSCSDTSDRSKSICCLTHRFVLSPKYDYLPSFEWQYFSHIIANSQSDIFNSGLYILRSQQFVASLDPPSKLFNTQFYISIYPNRAPPISS